MTEKDIIKVLEYEENMTRLELVISLIGNLMDTMDEILFIDEGVRDALEGARFEAIESMVAVETKFKHEYPTVYKAWCRSNLGKEGE